VGRLTPQNASRNRSVIATSEQLVKPVKTGKQCKVSPRRLAAFTKKHGSYAAATVRKGRAPANGSGISANIARFVDSEIMPPPAAKSQPLALRH
jgi:hypothetical protein